MTDTYNPDLLVIDVFTETPVDDLLGMDVDAGTGTGICCDKFDDVCARLSDYVLHADLSGEFDGISDNDELVEALLDGLPIYTELHSTAFRQLVTEWLWYKLCANPEDVVRGYVQTKHGFSMVHGIGYDWLDDDVLGGNGDGSMRDKFNEWCAEKFNVRVEFV